MHRRRRSRRGGRAIITQGHTETAALGAYVPYTLDRKNRQSDIPDRASLPRKRTRNAPREKKKRRGLRTIRTAVPLPAGQHSTCGPATAPSILVSALARANVSPKLLLNLQRDLTRDVKSGGFGPRPESPPFSCGIYSTTLISKQIGHYSNT